MRKVLHYLVELHPDGAVLLAATLWLTGVALETVAAMVMDTSERRVNR